MESGSVAQVNWKVEGMDCANCALSISSYLTKKGMVSVKVNPVSGEVFFENKRIGVSEDQLKKGIEDLGYTVREPGIGEKASQPRMNKLLRYLLICLPFTAVLMLHMLPLPLHWLMNGWVQCALCLPVYVTGMYFFGRSAFKSLRHGIANMNVLIALGATAAFGYSLAGTVLQLGSSYLFYESAAAIITLVFLGNYLEELAIAKTQQSLNSLVQHQEVTANMIAFDDKYQEVIFPLRNDQLKPGDLVLIKAGEQVPADSRVLTGTGSVDEAIITGESRPVEKGPKSGLIGGSLLTEGTLRAQVTAGTAQSVLSNIIDLVKRAQGDKPPVQLLADRISAVFVPVVVLLAVLTFLVNLMVLHDAGAALSRSIAVLVIACPCAMGLATPAAIAVGLGRAARNGILFRNAHSLEAFNRISTVIFDKTGTLTTGKFIIRKWQLSPGTAVSGAEFRQLLYSLEKFSGHPLARSITEAWKGETALRWKSIEEIKGVGMKGVTMDNTKYEAGSYRLAAALTNEHHHDIYLLKNGMLAGWLDMQDETRPGAKEAVAYFSAKGIRTVLLSGDRKEKVNALAEQLGIAEVFAEQTPAQKMDIVENLSAGTATAMIGDGINDAPALARAGVGIALSDATQVAIQTADVVLMNSDLFKLPEAIGLGKHTLLTIRQNLFWAFFYNVLAIPFAAAGMIVPAAAALLMGLSDIVLVVISLRLYVKKVC